MFETTTLPNGIRVATARLPTRTALTAVITNVGARCETKEENGLSHFLEHMAFKGTTTRDARTLGQTVERLGCDFNAFTSHTMTAYFVRGLSEHLHTGVEILADIMQNSVYDPEELAREQDVVIQEIHQYADEIDSVAWDAFQATCYPDQSLGRTVLGPIENIESFTQDMVKDYFTRHYHAGEMALISVGDVDHQAFVSLTLQHFGDMKGGEPNTKAPAEYKGGNTVISDERFEQAHITMGLGTVGYLDESYPKYDLLAQVLGGGMSSPLFYELREKRGLCYQVSSFMNPLDDHSVFGISGATTPKNLNQFIKSSAQELAKIARGEVDPVDFERALNGVLFSLAHRDEKAMNMVEYAARGLFQRGYIETTDNIMERYKKVTIQDVIDAAKDLVGSPAVVAVAGNVPEKDYRKMFEKALKV